MFVLVRVDEWTSGCSWCHSVQYHVVALMSFRVEYATEGWGDIYRIQIVAYGASQERLTKMMGRLNRLCVDGLMGKRRKRLEWRHDTVPR